MDELYRFKDQHHRPLQRLVQLAGFRHLFRVRPNRAHQTANAHWQESGLAQAPLQVEC